MTPEVDLVLFDLGGVLVRLGRGVDAMQRLAGLTSPEEVWRRWLTCEWVRSFERGSCTPDDFAQGVVEDWALSISAADFLEQFRGWPDGVFDGARELLDQVRQQMRVGCLSNTNALHWGDHSTRWGLDDRFDLRFLSFEVGLIKPDQEIFEHVCEAAGTSPHRIVFLDDNQLNVDQAVVSGFVARRVSGPDEARAALEDLGVIRGRRPGG